MRSIVVIVAYKVPEWGLGSVMVELMMAESANWEACLIGLRALLIILINAPRAGNPDAEMIQSMVSLREFLEAGLCLLGLER